MKVVQEEFGGFGYEWTATYDGLNRRLQTTFVPKRGNLYQTAEQVVERSWYDPLVEFLEVGLEVTRGSGSAAVSERWWKVHGPDLSGGYGGLEGLGGLEALVNEASGQAVGTTDDAYGHIIGFAKAVSLSAAGAGAMVFEWNDAHFGGYGPLSGSWSPSIAEGMSVWRAFGWRGKRLDATGFYQLGDRAYEPICGRFLSTDPMGHGASMSLYDYAGGDPINFADPNGRQCKDTSGVTASYMSLSRGEVANRNLDTSKTWIWVVEVTPDGGGLCLRSSKLRRLRHGVGFKIGEAVSEVVWLRAAPRLWKGRGTWCPIQKSLLKMRLQELRIHGKTHGIPRAGIPSHGNKVPFGQILEARPMRGSSRLRSASTDAASQMQTAWLPSAVGKV